MSIESTDSIESVQNVETFESNLKEKEVPTTKWMGRVVFVIIGIAVGACITSSFCLYHIVDFVRPLFIEFYQRY